jgi:hypothetical protein
LLDAQIGAAHGHLLDLSTVPGPDDGTLKAVSELRAKAELSADERAFLEYFELLEEIRLALGVLERLPEVAHRGG